MARRRGGLDGAARLMGLAALLAAGLSACATPQGPLGGAGAERLRAYNRPYQVNGRWYRPEPQPDYDAVGAASWYSYETHNRTTADGEAFDARLLTAAHTTLPIPSYLEVTNLANGRRVRVRLNDRGPFVSGRIIDVSRAAAAQLGFVSQGTARVRVRYLGPAPLRAGEGVATARVSAPSPEGDE
jgi:rare lipoprotein A